MYTQHVKMHERHATTNLRMKSEGEGLGTFRIKYCKATCISRAPAYHIGPRPVQIGERCNVGSIGPRPYKLESIRCMHGIQAEICTTR